MVQEAQGWISDDAMAEVAKVLDLTPAYVKGVVTFYTMYHQHPVGKHVLMVCTNVSCMLRGGYQVLEALEDKLGIKRGETTADGEFTIIEEECLAACADAPCLIAGHEYHLRLTPETAVKALEHIKQQPADHAPKGTH
jgi:NADH-quinone oxidoreductase E subunit